MKSTVWMTLTLVRLASAMFAAEPPVTGDELLKVVRQSQALQDFQQLKGALRSQATGQKIPMELSMKDGSIRFLLREPNEIINLDLGDNGSRLYRVVAGAKKEVPPSLYSDHVRNTDLNYEDLSMRFLYWPHAKILGEDSISSQSCWIVRVTNPDGRKRGPYGTVDIWVAKKSGGMAKMEAHDADGRRVKQFLVRKIQHYNDAYILEQMRVESFDPDKGKSLGITYMEIDDPGKK